MINQVGAFVLICTNQNEWALWHLSGNPLTFTKVVIACVIGALGLSDIFQSEKKRHLIYETPTFKLHGMPLYPWPQRNGYDNDVVFVVPVPNVRG